ncbi:MAG TPA: hypothetical protein VE422_21610 [Terriglobia bacterium]|nr:hypothetical protein [Terriglobia bacterium]
MFTELLFDIGTRLGREHAQDHERFHLHWEEHVQRSREMILRGAQRVKTPDSLTILGAGAAYNIPLEDLARQFKLVRMVDIDREGLQQAAESVPPELRSKVEVHVADTTGGVAARLLGQGLEIIRTSEDPKDTQARLIALFNGQGLDMTPDPSRVQAWKASYIVSSGLSTQLTIFPEKALLEAFQEKFRQELDDDFFFQRGSSDLRNEWVRRHGELLASLVSQDGRVYWADTVAETPYLSEFGEGPLNAVVNSVVSFLTGAYPKTFLTDAGKQALAERFAEAVTLRLSGDAAVRRRQGDELLQSFNEKLDAEKKRVVAWAIMTMVGENLIVPKRESELVGYIIREAERMNPNARQPMLEGGLTGFFPSSLEAEAEMASWLWINDPEGAVTLDGHSYYVEAHILKLEQS